MAQIAEAFVRVRPLATGFGQELDKQVKPGLSRFENQLKSSRGEMERFSRGAVVGTGALRGLGRAAAFASVSFIGGAGLVYGLKSTVKAAMDAQSSLAQTQNAVTRSGLSWETYGEQIKAATLAQAELSGFDDERMLKTFSTLVRRTQDVNKALQLNALAANVARGRNIELEAATQLVLRASIGMSGALRRLGIDAKAGSTGIELLQLLQQRYGNSAATFADTAAGAQARFNVALQNTQETIGAAVLPSITKLLNKGTDWLNNTKNQKLIQDDLSAAMTTGATAATVLADSFGLITAAARPATGALGSLKKALNDLGGGPGSSGGIGSFLFSSFPTQIKDLSQFIESHGGSRNRDALLSFLGIGGGGGAGSATAPSGLAGAIGESGPPGLTGPLAAVLGPGGARSAATTRGDATATALAQAQAGGIRARITAAANARLAFINDTIAFANKLLSQGRGNTKQLQATLQKFYGEKGSVQDIITAFLTADSQAAKDAAAKQAAAFAESQQLLIEQRAASKKAWTDYLEAQAAKNLETQQLLLEQRNASKQAYADYLKGQQDLKLQGFENQLTSARLISNPEKAIAAERKVDQAMIRYYEARVSRLKKERASLLDIAQAESDVLTAKLALKNTTKQATTGSFSLQQLFAEADKELALYGSNISAGGPLSPQEGRAAFAANVKSHQTTVIQNFNYPKSASQALNDAHAGARNLKT